jgi:hypothetical protein
MAQRKNNYNKELVTGGIVAAIGGLVLLTWLIVHSLEDKPHGWEGTTVPDPINIPTAPPPSTTVKKKHDAKHTLHPNSSTSPSQSDGRSSRDGSSDPYSRSKPSTHSARGSNDDYIIRPGVDTNPDRPLVRPRGSSAGGINGETNDSNDIPPLKIAEPEE